MTDATERAEAWFRARIAMYGYTMLGVFDPDGVNPPFVYTIGLTNKDWPELLLIGNLDPRTAEAIITQIVAQWERLGVFYGSITGVAATADGVDLPMMLRAVQADEALEYAAQVPNFCPSTDGHRFVQVVWPDRNGCYPYDAEYDTRYTQPLLAEEK